jgi:hypothetical protein
VRFARLAGLTTAGLLTLAVAAPATAADDAMVRVLHGSPDAPSVDILVEDTKNDDLSGLEFGEFSDYVAVPGGTYNVKVCLTSDNATCVIDADLTFDAGKKYTVAASDLAAQIKADVFTDGNATAGETRVRAVHLSADTPPVDVRPDGTTADDAVVQDLAYRSASDYLQLPGGAYDLEVCAAGTDTCPLDLDEATLKNGVAYSVYAIGQLEPTGEQAALTAVVLTDGMAAPASDTVAEGTTTGSGTSLLAVLALAAAAAFGVAGSLRLATVRARK